VLPPKQKTLTCKATLHHRKLFPLTSHSATVAIAHTVTRCYYYYYCCCCCCVLLVFCTLRRSPIDLDFADCHSMTSRPSVRLSVCHSGSLRQLMVQLVRHLFISFRDRLHRRFRLSVYRHQQWWPAVHSDTRTCS